METIVPFKTENTYLATEFLMKDPYKNTRLISILESNPGRSMIIYDNGVIKGILAVDPVYNEMWFHGNSKSLKAVVGNIDIASNQILYIERKNLDIIQSKFNANYSSTLAMRLKIRDYSGETGDGIKLQSVDIEDYKTAFGKTDVYSNIYIKRQKGKIAGSVKVLSHNIKTCCIGCLNYKDGEEETICGIISSIINDYKSQSENIVIYASNQEKLKDQLIKFGFTYAGELLKLYNIVCDKKNR